MRRAVASTSARVRRGLGLCALATALVLGAAACSDDEEEAAPPTAEAGAGVRTFIPAGSPVYVEFRTDFDGEQWTQTDELAMRFPSYDRLRAELDEEINDPSEGVTFDEVRELLGERAAFALTEFPPALTDDFEDPAAGASTDPTFMLAAELAEGQEDAVRELLDGNGFTVQGECEGVEYLADDDDTVVALADGAMVLSDTSETVCASLAAHAQGGAAVIEGEERYGEALAALSEDALVRAYFDAGAIVRELAADTPELEQLGLADQAGEAVVAASVTAEPEGVRVQGLITGAPEGGEGEPFTPALLERVGADAYAYVGLSDAAGTVGDAFGNLEGEAGQQLQQQLEFFSAQLERQLGVTVEDVAALFGGEQAIVLSRGALVPALAIVLQVDDGARAEATLDSLRMAAPSLIGFINPFLTLPEFARVELENGVQGWELPLSSSPEFGVVYGVDGDLAILGSTTEAVRRIQSPAGESLPESEAFQAGTPGMPESITGLLWINVAQSVTALEQLGVFEEFDEEVAANLGPVQSLAAWGEAGENPSFTVFLRIAE